MNRHRKNTKRRRKLAPLWTYETAHPAAPYIASVLRSLREQRLEAQALMLRARRLKNQPGRPDRDQLIARQEAAQEARRAADRYRETARELHDLGVYCHDLVRGEAVLPFIHENLLAWLHFDLFADAHLGTWRFHADPSETRRPVSELSDTPAEPLRIV